MILSPIPYTFTMEVVAHIAWQYRDKGIFFVLTQAYRAFFMFGKFEWVENTCYHSHLLLVCLIAVFELASIEYPLYDLADVSEGEKGKQEYVHLCDHKKDGCNLVPLVL